MPIITKQNHHDHIAVIGAGWAGCAAAVTLAQAGRRVTLFERARMLGGRARRVDIHGCQLDNGQHILLGAYRAALHIMQTVGLDLDQAMLRLPLQIRYPIGIDGLDFVTPRLPAPWHMTLALVRARGLRLGDKLALARFAVAARRMNWRLPQDDSVATLLERFAQTERLNRLLWTPLCIAALNTPPQYASAQVFLNVLRDSLGADRAASDMLIPRIDLSDLFPARAAAFVKRLGGAICVGRTALSITAITHPTRHASLAPEWCIRFRQDPPDKRAAHFDGVIVATAPQAAADLLDAVIDTSSLRAFDYQAISTCYLQYPASLRLPQPFYTLLDAPDQAIWGQFVFDRGQSHADHSNAGLLAVVISAAARSSAQSNADLATGIAIQLARQLQNPMLQTPLWSKVITEKHATFTCLPHLPRPDNTTMPRGLALAGDYLISDYPATLEAAVQGGIKAAQRLLAA